MKTSTRTRGLTMIELILALGIASFIMLALFKLVESSLSLWRRGEVRRSLLEQSTVIGDLIAADLREIDNTKAADIVAEWVPFDTDANGGADELWPRLRLVRRATPAEIERLKARLEVPPDEIGDEGLVEVIWCALPTSKDPDERDTALLYRGERLVGDEDSRSFFEPGFIQRNGEPPAGSIDRVSGGLLYLELLYATQTSIVHDGWKAGDSLENAATSWDAWNKGRPDPTKHLWNNPGAGMPAISEHNPRPLLPRRVRVTFEFEREVDRIRRTRTSETIAPQDTSFEVDNPKSLPPPGDFIKLGHEWMQVISRTGSQVFVRRGQRGTRPVPHEKGELVHFGHRAVREVPVRLYREDWS